MTSLHFGALCEPIAEQLLKQGFSLTEADATRFQKMADCVVRLHLNGLIPDSVRDNAHKKLMKQISDCIHEREP
jgi:hypothetical protein